jgi:hydrolase, TatD family
MYTDTHFHLNNEYYEDIEEVIKEANDNNVRRLIISSFDKRSIIEAIEIVDQHENIYMTLGFHPEVANDVTKEDVTWLKEQLKHSKCIAVGEIGYDYYWNKENKEKQKEVFKDQLDLATELDLPVVIHSRDSFQDTYDTLSEYSLKGIIHCFGGSIENAKRYIALGYHLGIGGVVTFKNSKLGEVIKEINLKNIVLETDSPYLAPEPYRGKKNGPKNIPIIASRIAEIKEIDVEQLQEMIEKNVIELFKI